MINDVNDELEKLLEDPAYKFYTISEAAKMLNTTEYTVRAALFRGLDYVGVGSIKIISQEAINDFKEKYKELMQYTNWHIIFHYVVKKTKYIDTIFHPELENTFTIDMELLKKLGRNYDTNKSKEERKNLEDANDVYYTLSDIYHLLGKYIPSLMAYCKQGKIKAVNPDGHKWFIKKDDFDILDPNILPQSMKKRFKRYLKKKYGLLTNDDYRNYVAREANAQNKTAKKIM